MKWDYSLKNAYVSGCLIAFIVLFITAGCFTPKVYYAGVSDVLVNVQPKNIFVDSDKSIGVEMVLQPSLITKDVHDQASEIIQNSQPTTGYLYKNAGALAEMIKAKKLRNEDVLEIQAYPNIDKLPDDFLSKSKVYSGTQTISYSLQKKDFLVKVPVNHYTVRHRKGWSYPLQIFLIPAAALDIAFSPFYLLEELLDPK